MSSKTQPSNRTIKNAFDSAEPQSLHALMLKNYGLILLARLEAAEAESKRYNDALTVAILAKQDAELLASHAHQKTYKDALIENTTAESRIADLEARLELTPESNGHDGIYARDETIRLQDKRIEELEGALKQVGELPSTWIAETEMVDEYCCKPAMENCASELSAILEQVKG